MANSYSSLQSLFPQLDLSRLNDPSYMAGFSGAPIRGSDGVMYDINSTLSNEDGGLGQMMGLQNGSINVTDHSRGNGDGGGGNYYEFGKDGNLIAQRQFDNYTHNVRDAVGMSAMVLGGAAAVGMGAGAAGAGAASAGGASGSVAGPGMAGWGADLGTSMGTGLSAGEMGAGGVAAGGAAGSIVPSAPIVASDVGAGAGVGPGAQAGGAAAGGGGLFGGGGGPAGGTGMQLGSGPGGAMTAGDYLKYGSAAGGVVSSLTGPKAPNMGDLINQQTGANLQTATANAELNRINQTSPWGSLSYAVTGHNPDGTPIYTQTTTLSPTQQQLFDLGQKGQINNANIGLGMQGQLASTYGSAMDTSSLPGLRSSPYVDGQTTASAIRAAQDAAYKDQTQYLDPQYAQQDESLRQQLANQGLDPNSQAYKNAMLNQSQTKQRAYQSAQNAAVTAGQNEQNTLYGQGIAGANLQNQSNQLGMQNLFSLRSQPLNEYNALTSGTQVNAPNFTGFQPVAMPNVNTIGTAQGIYGLQQANQNAQTSGLFSLAGAAQKSNLFGTS